MINASRGEIIDTNVLIEGIENGIICGAGIDSFENEQEVIYTTLIGFVIQLLIELIKKKCINNIKTTYANSHKVCR